MSKVVLLVNETSLAPELDKVTAPVKALEPLDSVIVCAPAVNDDVPGTISAPFCVMAPPVAPSIIVKF